jgi:eukaryotic-like serine/threonine-protein kinase
MANADETRRFGSLAVDLRSGEVQKNGKRLRLQEQPFQVLAALVERPGEVVTREELRQRVWPANTFVDFNNGLNIAIVKLRQALHDDAAKPRYIETLPKRGYRFIAPAEGGGAEVGAVVPAAANPPAALLVQPASSGRGRSVLALAAMAAAAVAVFGLGSAQFFPQTGAASAASAPRPSAAIIGFRNLSANPADNWLSIALAEMLSTDLAAGERLRTIPGESVARARIDLALPDADSYSAATLARIRKNLGADYIVVGSYLNPTGQSAGFLQMDLRLQDARTGQTIGAISQSGSRDNLPDLVSRAGLALRRKLNLAPAGQAETSGVRAALSASPDTARLYAEGLALLRRFDAAGARTFFEQAVKADPGYALARAALARAWAESGYAERARQEAAKAWEASRDLPLASRLVIEATYRQTTGEWDKAAQIYQQLRDRFPDEVDYGLRLALAQTKAGHAQAALASLDKLRRLPPPLRDDPAIDFTESLVAEQAGDLRQSGAAAAKAAAGAGSRGARMLVADANSRQCRVLRWLGQPDDARAACEQARETFASAGDQGGVATITGYLAAIRADEDDLAGAQELYARALAIDRQIDSQSSEGGAIWQLNGLADLLWSHGDLAGARKSYQESLDIARTTGSRPDEADALDNIAVMHLFAGDLTEARQLFEQALEIFRAIPDKSGVGNVLGNLGETLYYQGDLPRAAQTLDQAVAIDREAGSQAETADALATSGRVLLTEGNPDAARQRYDEAFRIQSAAPSPGDLARHRMRLAELAIETGRPAEAEAPLREGLEIFQKENRRDFEIEARVLLARALMEEGKTAEAGREIERARNLVKSSQRAAVRLELETAAARVRAASDKPSDANRAIRSLEPIIADARKRGFLGYQLAARLALGEAELHAGRVDGARTELEMVEKDARERGFAIIAKQAAVLRTRPGAAR